MSNYNALSAEQRLERSAVQIMRAPKFIALSGILMMGETSVVERGDKRSPMGTAATNGKDKYYSRDFVMGLSEQELNFVVIHEAKHVMYQHLTIWAHLYKQDPKLANMAADFVINNETIESDPQGTFAKMPKGGLASPHFNGMDTQSVFKQLQQIKQQQQQQKDKGQKVTAGKDKGVPDMTGDDGEGMDYHDWEDADSMTDEQKQNLQAAVDQAIRQGAILAGKMGGDIDRGMIEAMKAKIDWREVLREFVVTSCDNKDQSTWRRPNRRWIQHDIYMPTQEGEAVGGIWFCGDTSGSIDNVFLGSFLGELASICETVSPEQVDVLWWDAAVAGHETYKREELHGIATSTKPKGGGGTVFSSVVQYAKEKKMPKPMCIVVCTDGYLGNDWGTELAPTLWVIKGNPGATAPYGITLHID